MIVFVTRRPWWGRPCPTPCAALYWSDSSNGTLDVAGPAGRLVADWYVTALTALAVAGPGRARRCRSAAGAVRHGSGRRPFLFDRLQTASSLLADDGTERWPISSGCAQRAAARSCAKPCKYTTRRQPASGGRTCAPATCCSERQWRASACHAGEFQLHVWRVSVVATL